MGYETNQYWFALRITTGRFADQYWFIFTPLCDAHK